MHKLLIVSWVLVCVLGPAVQRTAIAQTAAAATQAVALSDASVTPRVTVRLHAGPSLNLMSDWRNGLDTLWDMTEARGLSPRDKSCICMSWGSTVLVHATERVAVGGAFEMLRDTRSFTVTDSLEFFGPRGNADFGFGNEVVVQTKQIVAAFYPREGSRTHVQVGGGVGSGHTTMSTPGSDANGRVRGPMFSLSTGTEGRFWYMDAGWRLLRMTTQSSSVSDFDIQEARDVFGSQAEVQEFVGGRTTDLTGGWVRAGLVFHFGRR
jgi:hypothetical protein